MRSIPVLPGLLACLLALASAPPAPAQEPPPAPSRSVMEGVYTMEQAERGAAAFEEECALCHEAADFSADVFEARWTGRPAAVLFSFMQDSLAHDEVADLDPEGYADLLAWVFRLNGFPAAATDLPAEMAALEDLRMEAPTGEPARVLATAAPPAGAAGASSMASGVFTAEQADRGRSVFNEICSACHGPSEFQSADFLAAWSRRHVGNLFAFVSENMPEDAPGSLAPQEYADVVAYILQLNGAPAGATALPPDETALAAIPFRPGATAAPVAPAAAPDPGELRSVRLGVYLESQAERGRVAWEGTCAACHETTDFHDEAFVEAWNGRLLGDLYAFVRENMPEDDPGSLPDAVYADILAYVLRLNGAPAAGLPLPPDPAILARLRLDLGDGPGERR